MCRLLRLCSLSSRRSSWSAIDHFANELRLDARCPVVQIDDDLVVTNGEREH